MKKYAVLFILAALLTGCGKVDTTSNTPDTPILNDIQPTTDESADVEDETETTTTVPKVKKEHESTTTAANFSYTTRSPEELAKRTTVPKSNSGRTNSNAGRPANNSNNNRNNTTQAPAPTAAPTTQPPTAAPTTEPNNDVMMTDRFGIAENGINIYSNGKKIQHLDVNTEAILANEHRELFFTVKDFDFDNHDDLFIPEAIGTLNNSGKYFRFNPTTGLFDEWKELNDIQYTLTPDAEKKELNLHARYSAAEYEAKTFEWKDKTLVLKTGTKQYKGTDGELYIDHYEFIDGAEKVVKREHLILDANNNMIGSEELPLTDAEW